jgi:hypothetical protein
MRSLVTAAMVAAICAAAPFSVAEAAPILQFTDFIIPIDVDPPVVPISDYPLTETPIEAFDGVLGSKYLNFGERNSGLIFTLAGGSASAQSLTLTTANDAIERDPASYKLWGTNDAITTPDNTEGPNLENWTMVSEGPLTLSDLRDTVSAPINFTNPNSYTSYRITFPTVKNFQTANSMQIGEISLYDQTNAGGTNVALFPVDMRAILLDPVPAFQSATPAAEGVNNILDGVGPRLDLPSQSNYPAAEGPANVVNGTLAKYLNGGSNDTGFIVTPAAGASTLKSFQITTANDFVDRDPTSYELYGTNQAIASLDNSYGTAESWTLIGSGALALPAARDTLGSVVPVANNASYTSYKMLFPTRVGPGGGMQIAEVSFFPDTLGAGTDILVAGDVVKAIDGTVRTGLDTKYLNFGENNSGLIVTPGAGAKVVTSMQLTTANDAAVRDPASYEIYGTNSPITSEAHGQGAAETWTLIASGALALPEARFTAGDVITFANTTAYTSYKIVFPTVKDATAANSLQIGGLQLFDASAPSDADFDNDGDVDGQDFLTWQRNVGVGTNNATGDADGNSIVNGADLAAWRAEFGPAAAAAVGSVPEPTSAVLAMFVGGLATLVGRGVGKRR